MRDIGARIQRRRLRRYAAPQTGWRRALPWLPLLVAAWAIYAVFLSEHGLLRIWRQQQAARRAQAELEQVQREIERLESEASDPERERARLEEHLRVGLGMARPDEIIYRVQPDTTR